MTAKQAAANITIQRTWVTDNKQCALLHYNNQYFGVLVVCPNGTWEHRCGNGRGDSISEEEYKPPGRPHNCGGEHSYTSPDELTVFALLDTLEATCPLLK